MHADKGTRHGRVARQEQRFSFFQVAGEAVANGVRPKIRSVVTHPYDNCSRLVFSWNYVNFFSFNAVEVSCTVISFLVRWSLWRKCQPTRPPDDSSLFFVSICYRGANYWLMKSGFLTLREDPAFWG